MREIRALLTQLLTWHVHLRKREEADAKTDEHPDVKNPIRLQKRHLLLLSNQLNVPFDPVLQMVTEFPEFQLVP